MPFQLLDGATGHADHRIGGGNARRKCIDAALLIEHVNRWHRHVGRQRQLLHDVQAAALRVVTCLWQDARTSHAFCHGLAAGGELYPFQQHDQANGGGDRQTSAAESLPGEK